MILQWNFYYRATLRVSAVFALARCPSVRLSVSVCMSHSCTRHDDIVKLLSRPGISPHDSRFFLTPCADTHFQGEPRQHGAKYTGGEDFAIFD